jgi:hypothetical protein
VKGFARREFELMLLRRMADLQPDLVEAACAEVGVTHGQYMAAHNRWQSMLHSRRAPQGLDLLQAVLGPPQTEREIHIGDATVIAHTWPLAGLWPDLCWEAIIGVGGVVLRGWLVREPGRPVPELALQRLAPWSCVVGDVLARFPGAQQSDPQIPSQWLVQVDGTDLRFVHGLLQTTS